MNSHIVEKTMHSIKNIDRLTDLAAIDVYNTTHDTINKYEIMKEHATEEYTNESFYQESVLAGVLIGAGVLGVAISAFFIIKKIIDSKDSADSSVKSSDGKMVAAQVDLSDPKSTEKYLTDLKARLEKLTETKTIKVTKSINKDEFAAAEKKINEWSEKLQEMIDNKHEAAEIEKIIDGMDISSVDVSKIFVNNEVDASIADFAEALGLRSISSFASLLSSLKKKIDDVEKMVNNKKDKEAENAVQISQDHLTKLKNQNNAAAKLIATLKAQSKETLSETDKAVLGAINAETEAKKKDEEAKPTEKSDGTGAAENKTEIATGENKTGEQSTVDTGSGAGGNDNTGKKSSTSENVTGPGGQTEAMRQASEAKKAAEAQNEKAMHIPEGSNDKANVQTLNEIINMLKSGKSDEDVMNYLKLNNYSDDQIKDFLAKAKETINGPKNKIIQALTAKGKPSTIAQNIANEICDKYNNDLVQYMNAQIAANPGDDKSAVWAKNEAYKNCMIIATALGMDVNTIPTPDGSVSEPSEPEKKPEDQVKTEPENSPAPTDQNDNAAQVTYGNDGEIIINGENTRIKKSWSDDMNERAEKIISILIENNYNNPAKITDDIFGEVPSGDIAARLDNNYQYWINKVKDGKTTPEKATTVTGTWRKMLLALAKGLGEDENLSPVPDFKSMVSSEPEKPPAAEEPKKDTDEGAPKDTQTEEKSEYPDDAAINEDPELKKLLIEDLVEYMKKNPDKSDEEVSQERASVGYDISPEMAKELVTSARELANKGSSENVPTETEEPKTENSPTPTDQNTGENTQETTPETSTEEPETKPEDTNGVPYNVLSAEYLQSLLNMPEQSAIEAIKKIKDEDIERMAIGIPKNIFVQLFENAASALATVSPATYLQQLTDMLNNNAAVNKIKALLYQIKQGDRTAFPKLKTTNFKELAELTDGRDVSDYITSILPRVKSAFDSLVSKYKPEMLKGASQIETRVLNIEQNVVTFFNFIKDACKGLVNKDKALDKVNDMESLIGQLLGKLDPNFSYGDAYSRNEFGNKAENTPDPFARQRRQGTATAPTPLTPSAPADWNDRMKALGKAGIPNKKVQVPEPKTAPTPLNPSAPQEWNDNMNALKSAGAENISQKTEVQPISPIDTDADIEKAKAEKAQLDALQQHRQEQLAQLKAERDQREQQVRNAYAQDAQARQNALDEELAKQSQEDEQKKAQAEELTKANEDANVTEAIRQAEEEKKALEQGKNLSVSPQSTEGLDNAAKAVAMQDFIKNFKDPAWREAHPDIESWQELYNSDGYKNEAIMKIEAERIKNEKLADNRAGIQFIKEQNYEAIVPSLDKVLETTSDLKTIVQYLDGLKTAYAKILMQYQQNPGNARKIIEDYSKNGAAPYEFYAVPYNELNQTQLIDWQQRLFSAKVELDKDRRRNRKKIKMVDKIIDKLIELDELLKTSVHNVIAAATKNPMRALEAALVMFQEGDEEIIAGLTAIENFINKADEVKASEEEADKTPENPAEEPSDEEVSQSILSILKS